MSNETNDNDTSGPASAPEVVERGLVQDIGAAAGGLGALLAGGAKMIEVLRPEKPAPAPESAPASPPAENG